MTVRKNQSDQLIGSNGIRKANPQRPTVSHVLPTVGRVLLTVGRVLPTVGHGLPAEGCPLRAG
jgi:hypothetical protein